MGMSSNMTETEKNKLIKQQAKKTHLRSLTSQKGEEQVSTHQRNNGRRQPSASGISGKGNR
jgi:hypothetical protein